MVSPACAHKEQRYLPLEAWNAIQRRDLEYAINLAIRGPWIDKERQELDGYSSLDARYGSERCQETSILAAIGISKVNEYLRLRGSCEEACTLVDRYRAAHVSDKRWHNIYELDDVEVPHPAGYSDLIRQIIDFIGDKWAKYLGWSRTITTFSILSLTECGMPLRYRRIRPVRVATTDEQRKAGADVWHDAEFPLRSAYSRLSFELMEWLAEDILPAGVKSQPFGSQIRRSIIFEEQIREVFHFSRAEKVTAGHDEYPITVGALSASMEILVRAAWKYGIIITVAMPRLRFQTPRRPLEQSDPPLIDNETRSGGSSSIYWLTSAPTLTFVPSLHRGGSYEFLSPSEVIRRGIADRLTWNLAGFSMYTPNDRGRLLASSNDEEFLWQLERTDPAHLLSIFGFSHSQYPAAVRDPPDVGILIRAACFEGPHTLQRTLEFSGNYCLNPNDRSDTASFWDVFEASSAIIKAHNLEDTWIARQHDQAARSSFTMLAKPVPFTFHHIDLSIPRKEHQRWADMARKHRLSSEPMYAHLFTIGNKMCSIASQRQGDKLMRACNDNVKVKSLLEAHPGHKVFLPREAVERFEKSNVLSSSDRENRKEEKARQWQKAKKPKLRPEVLVVTPHVSSSAPVLSHVKAW